MKCFTFPLSGLRKEAGETYPSGPFRPIGPGFTTFQPLQRRDDGGLFSWLGSSEVPHGRLLPGPYKNTITYDPNALNNFREWADKTYKDEKYPEGWSEDTKSRVRNLRRNMLRRWSGKAGEYIGPRGEGNAYFQNARLAGLLPEQYEDAVKKGRDALMTTDDYNFRSAGTTIRPVKVRYKKVNPIKDAVDSWGNRRNDYQYRITEFDGKPVK